jgi:uncharacterized protein GlcG (DUF336 family)
MKTENARRALEASRAQAEKMGKAVSIVVVDATGTPVVLERMEGARRFTTLVAEGKAVASALMGRESAGIAEMMNRFPSIVNSFSMRVGGRFMAAQGAVPVLDEAGESVGAVGVSGAAADEDEQIARAGVEAMQGS